MRMTPPLVALIGRPNVGKSTLFNRIMGRRAALVMDRPGVTRDRIFGEASIEGKRIRVVDTGGIEFNSTDVFLENMREQTRLAIEEADLIVFLLDGAAGVQPADHEVAQMVRRAGKEVIGVVNKLDVPAHDMSLNEFYELGIDSLFGVSAEHGRGFGELLECIADRVEAPTDEEYEGNFSPIAVSDEPVPEGSKVKIEWKGEPIRVAVIGRPNAGKSSLINRLLGEERLLATPVAGTTRDPVDTELTHDEQDYVFVDTAGMRRKRSIGDKLEHFSVVAAVRSLETADVALMVLDAGEVPAEQDAKIAALAHERGKGIVLVANKWDLVEDQDAGSRYMERLERKLSFLDYAPMVRISAKTGRSVHKLFRQIVQVQVERHKRVGTSELNRYFRDVVDSLQPPAKGNARPRLYYVSQPMVRPPTFVFMAKRPDLIRDSYKRYLLNALRDRYGFHGTPLWLKFREHSKSRPGYGGLKAAED